MPRTMHLFAPVALLVATLGSHSPGAWNPPVPRCAGEEYRQFDFWIGTWDVQQRIRTTDGSYLAFPATDTVRTTLDGCALLEHWHGTVQFFWAGMTAPGPLEGLSVRAYDAEAGAWRIHWMDTQDPRFGAPFTGTFHDGTGTFFLDVERPDGTTSRRRITFANITPDTVDWELAVSTDAGANWVVLWTMHFTRQ